MKAKLPTGCRCQQRPPSTQHGKEKGNELGYVLAMLLRDMALHLLFEFNLRLYGGCAMTKVTIDRELLERFIESDTFGLSMASSDIAAVRAILAAPRQPVGDEIAWSLRSEVASCGLVRHMTDHKYQAQTQAIKQWYEPFRCQQCTYTQRTIAELREECERLRAEVENKYREPSKNELALEAERDTLRAELEAIKGQEPVAFYWQDIGYPDPRTHGPHFGRPSESALRNVDGRAIPVLLYTLPPASHDQEGT